MKNNSVLNIYDAVQDYGFTSQDYFVHMLRFAKMTDLLIGKNVVDVGCGKHCNLVKALCQMRHGPQFNKYIGIDYGDVKPWRMDNELIKSKVQIYGQCDFTDAAILSNLIETIRNTWGDEPFIIVCFEVLEHMDLDSQLTFMYHLARLLKQTNSLCYFSTPNFNGSAAKNHINELSANMLEAIMFQTGIIIENAIGLSCWTKYFKVANLPERYRTSEVEGLLYYLGNILPKPLIKIVWGALLDKSYSNNILWSLKAGAYEPRLVTRDDIKEVTECQNVG